LLVVSAFIFLINKSSVDAKYDDKSAYGVITVDLDNLQEGSTIVLFEDNTENYKVVVDVLPCYHTTTYSSGNSGWSSQMPTGRILRLYPHIEGSQAGHKEMGFYEDVIIKDGTTTILSVYDPIIQTGFGISVSEGPQLSILNKTATTITAKASLTWVSQSIVFEIKSNNYLTSEFNKSGQMKLSWKFQD
jgi:hypothetical protein